MAHHPYRRRAETADPNEVAPSGVDFEERAVHGAIAAVGALGIVIGAIWCRTTELALGGLMLGFVLRSFVRALRRRARDRRRARKSREDPRTWT